MTDNLSIDQRHHNMSRIRAKNTKPEIVVRKYLWSHGFRYRLNHPRLPGKPDIVLRKYRTCIFVNGCFWHGHGLATQEVKSEELKVKNVTLPVIPELNSSECCKITGKNQETGTEQVRQSLFMPMIHDSKCCIIPKTNREFWVKKIMRNKERDIEVKKKLASMGWHSITIWECELKPALREQTLASLAFTLNHIFLENHKVKRYEMPEEKEYGMVAEDSREYNK